MLNTSPVSLPMTAIAKHDCIIVGGGWAGLACAVKLTKNGLKPLILEAATNLGGRARSIQFGDLIIDNGQHIMLGAYQQIQKLLANLSVPTNVISQSNFNLNILNNLNITLPNLPKYCNLIWGLVGARGINIKEKYFLFKFFLYLQRINFTILEDCTTAEYFMRLKMPPKLITCIFKPLVVSALSTPYNLASAQVFLRVLKLSFTGSSSSCNWLFAESGLSALLPVPAGRYLLNNEVSIKNNCLVTAISKQDGVFKLKTKTETFFANKVVLAIPPRALIKLKLLNLIEFIPIINQLKKITSQPITTIYYKFSEAVNLPHRILGLMKRLGDFVFAYPKQSNLISVVISSTEKILPKEHSVLAKQVFLELKQDLSLPEYIDYKVICEKFAAFASVVNVDEVRPGNLTPVPNLFLAGDYTNTQLPATLEGAVQSGNACADFILNYSGV